MAVVLPNRFVAIRWRRWTGRVPCLLVGWATWEASRIAPPGASILRDCRNLVQAQPTPRIGLITGRNHHLSGFGIVAEIATCFRDTTRSSGVGLPGLSGVGAPSPDGKRLGPHSPTRPAAPNPTGRSPRPSVPFHGARAGAARREEAWPGTSRSMPARGIPKPVIAAARAAAGSSVQPGPNGPAARGHPNEPKPGRRCQPRAPWNPNEPKPNSNSNAPELHQNPNEPEPVARDTNWGSLKTERTQGGSEPSCIDAPLTSAGCRLGGFLCPEGTL